MFELNIKNVKELTDYNLLYNAYEKYIDISYNELTHKENPEVYGFNISFVIVPTQNYIVPVLFINDTVINMIYCFALEKDEFINWLDKNEISDRHLFNNYIDKEYQIVNDNFFNEVKIFDNYKSALNELNSIIKQSQEKNISFKERAQQYIFNGIIDNIITDIDKVSYRSNELNKEVVSVKDIVDIIYKYLKKYNISNC